MRTIFLILNFYFPVLPFVLLIMVVLIAVSSSASLSMGDVESLP